MTMTRDAYFALVGKEIGISAWHTVDQSRIDAFADVTEDHQFIHIDPDRAARETPFGAAVAHGFLTLSLLSVFSYEALPKIEGATMGVNYGTNKVRFPAPVPVGSRLRCTATITGVEDVTGGVQVTVAFVVEREGGDKPVCVAESVSRYYV